MGLQDFTMIKCKFELKIYKKHGHAISKICGIKLLLMRTLAQKPKSQPQGSFEDLEDESFGRIQWNPAMLNRALPKENNKIKKMRSRWPQSWTPQNSKQHSNVKAKPAIRQSPGTSENFTSGSTIVWWCCGYSYKHDRHPVANYNR